MYLLIADCDIVHVHVVYAPASCDEEDALYSSICNLIVPSLTD